jgi:signal recognition particle receptor subunit alpha
MRKWDAEGNADEDDGAVLDYSAPNDTPVNGGDKARKIDYVEQKEWGNKTSKGEFVLKELGEEVDEILRKADAKESANNSTAGSGAFSFFKNIVGGKVLTKSDLDKALAGMQDHLVKKNVAQEAAIEVCKTVEKSLVGQKTGSFQSKLVYFSQARKLC